MNSVMDDNLLLTLPNGERIRPTSRRADAFEALDLWCASPATISRCGMVYVDPKDLGWQPYLWKWLNGRTRGARGAAPLCAKYLESASTTSGGHRGPRHHRRAAALVTPMSNLAMIQ